MDIVAQIKKRYTTKAYDPTKKIPQEKIDQLCTLLRHSPSSVNSQPWHFFVAGTDAGKAKVAQGVAKFNEARVLNASHVVVMCARTEFSEEHLNNLLAKEEADGRFPSPMNKKEQDAGRRHFLGLNNATPESLLHWESNQLYLALGMLLFAASCLDIDSTPIEGFDTAKMDEVLGLKAKGFTSVIVASLGYRGKEDFNAQLPKSRLSPEDVLTFL